MTPQASRNQIREVVWPMLRRLRADLALRRMSAAVRVEPAELPPSQPTTLHRQLLQFRILNPSLPGYVGDSGTTGGALDESYALYRAVGGERVSRFTISRRPSESVTALSVRLEVTDHQFQVVSATSAYCVVTLPATIAIITPDIVLQPGQMLVMRHSSGNAPIDTTTEITWPDT